jgi:hypothetical protein
MRASPRRASPFAVLRSGLVFFVATLSLSCGVGDQFCTEDQSPSEKNDDCPYGPPGGPKPPVGVCPDIPQDPQGSCSTDWVNDVFPIFATEGPGEASCTSLACHGSEKGPAAGVLMPPDDAKASFDALTRYEGAQKYPYVNLGDPKHSWILCNLADPPGVGQVMPDPPGELPMDQYAIVEAWAKCGMLYDKAGVGGAGGSGGSGGAGGAGGM